MQFNLVNDQEQVAQCVRRGMAWRRVAGHSIRVYCRGRPEAFVAWVFCFACPGHFRAVLAVSGSVAHWACTCAWPRGFGLTQRSVWWRLCAF